MGTKNRQENNEHNIEVFSYNTGDSIMVNCLGNRLYPVLYYFDSMINPGRIWVKFDCGGNKSHKVFFSICILETHSIERRKLTSDSHEWYLFGLKC